MPTSEETPGSIVAAHFLWNRLRMGVLLLLEISIYATGTLRPAYRNLLFFWQQRTESRIDLTALQK